MERPRSRANLVTRVRSAPIPFGGPGLRRRTVWPCWQRRMAQPTLRLEFTQDQTWPDSIRRTVRLILITETTAKSWLSTRSQGRPINLQWLPLLTTLADLLI